MIKNPSHPKKGHIKKRECKFTKAGIEYIDYKDTDLLERFMNEKFFPVVSPEQVPSTSDNCHALSSVPVFLEWFHM